MVDTQQIQIEGAVVRFVGDSGDGMQLTGTQFTDTSAIAGNDISTFPDFPAEIRAPAGTPAGVSGFQVNFAASAVEAPGDQPDILVAMNPAAYKMNIEDLKTGGVLIVNSDNFSDIDLRKAGYETNPLEDNPMVGEKFQLISVPMTALVEEALKDLDMKPVHKRRCKNFFALGLMYWMFDRTLEYTEAWILKKFGGKDVLEQANIKALRAGYNYGDTAEIFTRRYKVKSTPMPAGTYRQITGNSATAYGLVAAGVKSGLNVVYSTYPITPASDILHDLSKLKNFGVKTVQAEDEIAACGVALGASYGGSLGVTASSGPGICLKAEFVGLAAMTELPLVIVDVQRGGPSTGLPTKTEQSDLMLTLFGRNGECPVPVIAASTPVDCFHAVLEAARIAVEYMTPVYFLSDGFIANSSDLWNVPAFADLPGIKHAFYTGEDGKPYKPYERDPETLARKWVTPGTPKLQNTLTGLEKNEKGDISYDGKNHALMCGLRKDKIAAIAKSYGPTKILGAQSGKVLILAWGGTYGHIVSAVKELQKEGASISYVHLRHINPLPLDLEEIIGNFDTVVVPEINLGQLVQVIRAKYAIDAQSVTQIMGKPFKVADLVSSFRKFL